MDRRKSLKTLIVGSIATGLVVNGCKVEPEEQTVEKEIAFSINGQTPEEAARDKELHKQDPFFTDHELATVTVLCDYIIPSDERSGSASDAEVPAFLDFMMKDVPSDQTTMQGGLRWLDHQCLRKHELHFIDCSNEQQVAMLNLIAYPEDALPENLPGVRFFGFFRNLVATGFFTSRMGIKDLGYAGNVPNIWNGVPQDVLDKHKLDYNNKWADQYVKDEDRESFPQWDENGNLTG